MRYGRREAAYHVNVPGFRHTWTQLRQVKGPRRRGADRPGQPASASRRLPEPRDETDEIATHGDTIRALNARRSKSSN